VEEIHRQLESFRRELNSGEGDSWGRHDQG
jgi:hypothetical protein